MTDTERETYNKTFTDSYESNVGNGVPIEAIESFLILDDDAFCKTYSEYYTSLADARGVFRDGYVLGFEHAKERIAT